SNSVTLARANRRVTLLEKAAQLGGRAMTSHESGFAFNLGPHALYAEGAATRTFKELGIQYSAHRPQIGGFALIEGRRETFPAGALSLMTTGLFTATEKFEAAQWLAKLGKLDASDLHGVTLHDWLASNIRHLRVRQLIQALARLTTYAGDAQRQSAAAAIRQIQLGISSGVRYLDGGWQSLVDGLRDAAIKAGATIETGQRAQSIIVEQGHVRGAALADGAIHSADAVIIAASPAEVVSITESFVSSDWLRQLKALIPVKAACLDVALARLPQPDARFALGIDQPLYFSVHSATAQLAPANGALIHVAKYLMTDETTSAKSLEAELEQVLDTMQPGWREVLVKRRFMPALTVNHALVTTATTGRPEVAVPEIAGLFIAGDWVGAEGQLADVSVASGSAAAHAAQAR
ncbi:MAG: NAD(P)/FAD-dependent oxidoreductase, partial [Acidobacteria bacterium]|nr:NAD(P)/FAD-dependent oxidoreductase [Acidobacteriota bacterium]